MAKLNLLPRRGTTTPSTTARRGSVDAASIDAAAVVLRRTLCSRGRKDCVSLSLCITSIEWPT